MVVFVLSACPAGLRGYLTRWLLEVAAGVFVGKVSARVRDLLWQATVEESKEGRAMLIFSDGSEQGLGFKVHGDHWQPEDFDGVMLMRRPPIGKRGPARPGRTGWSQASKRRRFGKS